jgi:L-histidine N-alpha-methyltransferase
MSALAQSRPLTGFARDVHAGLTRPEQKELPSVYLYDAVGTALFETITLLDAYGLTRADERILERNARAIAARLPGPAIVAELGSGTGRKTRWLLETMAETRPIVYYPIDVSPTALERCRREIEAAGSIAVVGLEREYLEGLAEAAASRPKGKALLVLFLGSTIGNFDRAAGEQFLASVRGLLKPGDRLLLGTDLEKPVEQLLLAYDDPAGVTAAFNLNLLARINRELGGDFDLRRFRHQARYDRGQRRIEMHLVSRGSQTVTIPGAGLTVSFEDGESIWTEACHKFEPRELRRIAARCGFRHEADWRDRQWAFAENLWVAV